MSVCYQLTTTGERRVRVLIARNAPRAKAIEKALKRGVTWELAGHRYGTNTDLTPFIFVRRLQGSSHASATFVFGSTPSAQLPLPLAFRRMGRSRIRTTSDPQLLHFLERHR